MKLSLSRFVDHFFIFQFFVFVFPFQTSNVFSLPSSSLSANKSRFSIILSSSEFLSLLVSVSVFSRLQIVVSSTTTTTTTREKRSLPHQTPATRRRENLGAHHLHHHHHGWKRGKRGGDNRRTFAQQFH